MDIRVVLDVSGVDLDDPSFSSAIDDPGHEVLWSENEGAVTATLFPTGSNPVSTTLDVARWIQNTCGHEVRVLRVNEELVGVSDIAALYSLNRETVRLWSLGRRGPGGFPTQRATLGGGRRGTMRVWALSDVAAWLDEHYKLSPGVCFLSPGEVAELNELLAHLDEAVVAPYAWQPVGPVSDKAEALEVAEAWDPDLQPLTPIPLPILLNSARTTATISR